MTSHEALADRPPPAIVDPVMIDGIEYAQCFGELSEQGQIGGFLGAFDATGKLLWSIKVYDNVRQPDLEGDVQDVFFRAMTLDPDGRLRIFNEEGYTFLVDVKTRHVVALPKPEPVYDEDVIPPPRRR